MGAAAPLPSAEDQPSLDAKTLFKPLPNGDVIASPGASFDDTASEHWRQRIFGRPVSTESSLGERLNRATALAILSSDALSSVAYGTEASLAVLLTAGVAALGLNLILGLVIIALMLIVGNSYRQTIHAYPNGGGSYIVAKDNLSQTPLRDIPGLVAAAALLVDYLLTVSVSVAAGVDAVASAVPQIAPVSVLIEVILIFLIAYINLRGVREAGRFFALPTFLFLVSFGLMLVFALARALTHGGLTHAAPPPPTFAGTQQLTVMLVLTAFASGCSAMTGVEAISNGVPIFQGRDTKEQSKNAAATLVTMIILLAVFFFGTTYLAWRLGITPNPASNPTVTAQIASYAFNGWSGWLFYVVQFATFLILTFAANTSFAGFPRLAAILANDNYLPLFFGFVGERLAFSTGIIFLAVVSALMLVIFNGNVTELINLYALGVFTAFTLSQTGMVIHWRRRRTEAGWRRRLLANGVGAVATGIVAVVIAVAKFDRGAWIVIVLIPAAVVLFKRINRYYSETTVLLSNSALPSGSFDVAIVPIFSRLSSVARLGRTQQEVPELRESLVDELNNATHLARRVVAINVVADERERDQFRQRWDARIQRATLTEAERAAFAANPEGGVPSGKLTQPERIQLRTIVSPYRTVVAPMVLFIRTTFAGQASERAVVLIPQREHRKLWEVPLQRRLASMVRRQIQEDAQRGDLTLINVPFMTERQHRQSRAASS